MQTNSKTILLATVAVLLFGAVYTSVGLEDANAMKAKKDTKKQSAKIKKGLLAQKSYKLMLPSKMTKK